MAYQPNIPTGTVNLDQDYLNLRGNFQQLDTTFGIDHLPFSNNTAQLGFHTVVHLITQSGNPGSSTAGQLFTKVPTIPGGGDAQLFFRTPNGGIEQLTGSRATTNGYGWFSGILLQWGNFDPNVSINVSFPVVFPNNVWNIQLTGAAANNSTFRNALSTGTLTTSGFTWEGSLSSNWKPIYFLAIGN